MKKEIEKLVPVPVERCYHLLYQIGSEIKNWHNVRADSTNYVLVWRFGSHFKIMGNPLSDKPGNSAPGTVTIKLRTINIADTIVNITVQLTGLFDPFKFMDKELRQLLEPFNKQLLQTAIGETGYNTEHNRKPVTFQDAYKIQLDPELEKIRGTTEKISVPPGVNIRIKRARTIEHSLNFDWNSLNEVEANVGLRQLFGITIRGQLEQKQGRTYQQSETIEYEIELNGSISTGYTLIWTDLWQKGIAEIIQSNRTLFVPFRFCETTQLEVIPE